MSDKQLPSLPKEGALVGGRFRITRLLGSGGFGTVFQALQENVGREVALKFLAPSVAKDPVNIERFRREAFHVSQLRHPNTITLYDYGQTEDGLFYMVMELLEGVSLAELIQHDGAVPEARAAHIFLQVLKSLTEAHQRGLVHRDLKPENIYLCEMFGEQDYVKVLDFGVAKMTMMDPEADSSEEKLTKAGRIFGTPMYMAPEQACAEPITPATDIYALGLLLFEMLTGLPPVTGRNRMDVIHKQIREEVPRLTRELQGTPLGDIIRVATRKEPEARYGDAAQMWEGFYEAIRAMQIVPAPRGASRPDISIMSLGVDPRATPAPMPSHEVSPPAEEPAAVAQETSSRPGPPPLPPPLPEDAHARESRGEGAAEAAGRVGQPDEQAPAQLKPPQAPPEVYTSPRAEEAGPEEATVITAPPQMEPHAAAESPLIEDPDPSLNIPAELPQLPLIGRDAEIRQLFELIGQSVQAQSGHIVLLEGEGGVGKTRVVWALREELFGAGVGMCVGAFRRGATPLETLREALADFWWVAHAPRAELEATVRADLEGLGFPTEEIDFLVDFLRPSSGELQERFEDSEEASSLFARIERVLLQLASLRPMALVLEDIQYADSATLSFLEYFAVTLRTQSTPIVVVLTLRSGERTLNPDLERSLRTMSANVGVGLSRVRLKRIRGRELSVLLDAALPMEARLKERIAWLSQGNPMHALQIVTYLQSSQSLEQADQGHWTVREGTPRQIELPPDLMDLMHLRVEQAIELNPRRRHLRETILWGATLGIRVPMQLLAQVMREEHELSAEEMGKNIEVLRRFGILHERVRRDIEYVEFDNSLLRESLLREVSDGEQARQMHRRAAEAKLDFYGQGDQELPLLEIAEHWRQADAPERYRDALFEAARRSKRRHDPRGAREQFRELMRLLEQRGERGESWGEALMSLAELSWRFGELGLAEDNYRSVLEADVLTGIERARAERGLAHLLVLLGRYPEAVRHYRAALGTSKKRDDQSGIAKALIGLSGVHLRQGDPTAGERVRARLEEMLGQLEGPALLGKVLLHLAEAAKRLGQMQERQEYLDRALAKYKASGDRQGLSDTMVALASMLITPGEDSPARNQRAERLLKDALEIKRAIGDRHGVAEIFRYLGTLEQSQGDYEASEHYLHQALRMHEALGAVFHVGASHNALAICALYSGDYETGDRSFDEAISCFDRVGDQLAVSHAMLNKGTLALNAGQIELARELLEETRQLKEKLGSTWGLYDLYNHLAILEMWSGDFDSAEARLEQTLEELAEAVADEDKAIARSLLGLLRCFQSRLQLAALELGRARVDAEEMGNWQISALCQANAAFYALLTEADTVYQELLTEFRPAANLYTLAPHTWLGLLESMADLITEREGSRQAERLREAVERVAEDLGRSSS